LLAASACGKGEPQHEFTCNLSSQCWTLTWSNTTSDYETASSQQCSRQGGSRGASSCRAGQVAGCACNYTQNGAALDFKLYDYGSVVPAGWDTACAALLNDISGAVGSCAPFGVATATLKVTADSATVVAGGSAIHLTATLTNSTAAVSWSLTGHGSLSANTGASVNYIPPAAVSSAEAATITATAGGLSDSVSITVNPGAVLSVSPNTTTVIAGRAPATFTAALSMGTASISWSLVGPGTLSTTSGATTTYTPPASVASTSSATVTATAGALSTSATLTILVPSVQPFITITPATKLVNAGTGAVQLTATLTGVSAIVQWTNSGAGTFSGPPGSTTASYTPPATTASRFPFYVTAYATIPGGNIIWARATITVDPVGTSPPTLSVTPTAVTLPSGSGFMPLSAERTSGSGAITWVLNGPGSLYPSSGSTIYYTPPATLAAETSAEITATSGTFTATSTVLLEPGSLVATISPATKSVHAGDPAVTLTAGLTGGSAPITWSIAYGGGVDPTKAGTFTHADLTATYTPPASATAPFQVFPQFATASVIVLATVSVSP